MTFYVRLGLCKSQYSYAYKIPKFTVYSYFYPGTEDSGIIPKFVHVNLKIIYKCDLYEHCATSRKVPRSIPVVAGIIPVASDRSMCPGTDSASRSE